MSINATVIFCDDIRRELAGTESLIGVRSDVFEYVAGQETQFLGKLGIFAKLSYRRDSAPEDFYIKISSTDDSELLNTGSAKQIADGVLYHNGDKELIGIHFSTTINNLPILPNKSIRVYLGLDGEEILIGELMFIPMVMGVMQQDA